MSYIHPAAVEQQRKRWTRPDAYRLAAPGTPEAKPPWERAEPAPAHDAMSAAELDAFYAEHLQVCRQLADIKFELALRRIFHKYSPDQPRVPAGNSDGGRDEQRTYANSVGRRHNRLHQAWHKPSHHARSLAVGHARCGGQPDTDIAPI